MRGGSIAPHVLDTIDGIAYADDFDTLGGGSEAGHFVVANTVETRSGEAKATPWNTADGTAQEPDRAPTPNARSITCISPRIAMAYISRPSGRRAHKTAR